ncbi:MAG: ABC transporter, partial [Dermabacter sp.]|nr:ABC transporter [Dermabacter sp.]
MRPNLDAKLQRSSGGTLKALRGLNPMNVLAAVFLAILILAAILAPVITTHDPLATGMPVKPPSGEHFFGTDQIGRDVFARVVYGARSSLIIGLSATALALLIAAVLGSFAATAHKWASEIL